MPCVVCEPCRECKYTDCVTVCPCECFYQDREMLYIDPIECIDCDACIEQCPVAAIFSDHSVPAQWAAFIELNAERSAALKESGGHITERQEPLEGSGCVGRKK
jgi:ferredoxin